MSRGPWRSCMGTYDLRIVLSFFCLLRACRKTKQIRCFTLRQTGFLQNFP
jgi:hypothetical protein